eukprot:2286821-Rhodomonas_salina.2
MFAFHQEKGRDGSKGGVGLSVIEKGSVLLHVQQVDRWVIAVIPKPESDPHAFPWQNGVEPQGSQADGPFIYTRAVLHNSPNFRRERGSISTSEKAILAKSAPLRCCERESVNQLLLRCEFQRAPIHCVKKIAKGHGKERRRERGSDGGR